MTVTLPHEQLVAQGLTLLDSITGLKSCLESLPHFCFSDAGERNLKNRFALSDLGLAAAIAAVESLKQNQADESVAPTF